MNLMGILIAIAAICLMILAAVYLWQDRLLYFPESVTIERTLDSGLQAWPSENNFRGLIAEPAATARGTAIVFHGNAGHAGYRSFYAKVLTPLGWRVILAEYPGYGPRAGAVGETSLVADAVETVMLAHQQHGGPLLLIGESLGAAVAAAAAARQPHSTIGLVLITPWDQLAHVAAYHYPWLPVKWLLHDPYDTVQNLTGFSKPVVVVVAENDRVVPARFGIALQASLSGPKQLLLIKSSNHNDWLDRVDASWWRALVSFAAP
jgi:uncharacterized protein